MVSRPVDLGRDYGSVGEVRVPVVGDVELRRAAWTLLGLADDAADAQVLLDALGIGRDVLVALEVEGL